MRVRKCAPLLPKAIQSIFSRFARNTNPTCTCLHPEMLCLDVHLGSAVHVDVRVGRMQGFRIP
jgi:hypothetical protein